MRYAFFNLPACAVTACNAVTMRNLGLSFCLALAVSLPASFKAEAQGRKQVDCLLEVDGQIYIDGQCEWSVDTDGSFQIFAPEYFAYLLTEGNATGTGYWNAEPGAKHAHAKLGEMRRKGACWRNTGASICVWKIGERR